MEHCSVKVKASAKSPKQKNKRKKTASAANEELETSQSSREGFAMALGALDSALSSDEEVVQTDEDLTLPEVTERPVLECLLLGPADRIRFQPKDPKAHWGVLDAVNKTRMVFTAWDGTSKEKAGEVKKIQMPFCAKVNKDLHT